MVTVSDDETIRVWDLDTLSQLYDFRAANEKPCAVAYHPHQQVFACGFRNGAVRVFNIGRYRCLDRTVFMSSSSLSAVRS